MGTTSSDAEWRPHPFSWAPGAQQRHATTTRRWSHGAEVVALCGATVVADNSVQAWWWTTCEPCDVEAHRLAGVPMPPGVPRRRGPTTGGTPVVGGAALPR
ncbi:zinc finger protein [Saccharopolyspora cebuensis]|uniref:zinc finger protein n=1 Tax=Saccharopolyspora cebuensis TaxID=418759 RepID=UPI0031E77242